VTAAASYLSDAGPSGAGFSDAEWSGEDGLDEQAARFDDTDGAYAIAEPDPFAYSAGHAAQARHPSLRAELRAAPPAPIEALSRPSAPSLPIPADLAEVLPHGLRRGSTIAVTSSVSLLLALIGTASAHGAWTALVGMPTISAEAIDEAGVALERLAIISPPDTGWNSASWTTAVGALLDAVDIVVARPGATGAVPGTIRTSGMAVTDGDARRLTARARSKDAVLMLFGQQSASWPAIEVQLAAKHDQWTGIGDGYGRIAARHLTVSATGKGRSARPRSTGLWLPVGTSFEPSSIGAPVESSAPTELSAVVHRLPELTELPDIGWAG
jgi:hypothetical protein